MNKVNLDRIVMARESRGLNQSELAERLGVPPSIVNKMESGLLKVHEEGVGRISEITKYPPGFFYQPGEAVPDTSAMRKREKVAQKVLTPIIAKMNIVRLQVQMLTRTLGKAKPELPVMDIKDETGPARAAALIRKEWNVGEGSVTDLTGYIERQGVPVWSFDFETDRVDSRTILTDDKHPLICVNSKNPGDRQRFSIAYQLGHLLMHTFTPVDDTRDAGHEANLFAAELLMPEKDIRPDYEEGITLPLLGRLKRKWKVSMIALLYRADDLGYLTANQKRYLLQQFNDQKIRKREPVELDVDPERPRLIRQWLVELKEKEGLDTARLAERMGMRVDEFVEDYLI